MHMVTKGDAPTPPDGCSAAVREVAAHCVSKELAPYLPASPHISPISPSQVREVAAHCLRKELAGPDRRPSVPKS